VDPLRSRTVGPYRLVAELGRGGQADVFLAVRRGPAGFSKLIVIKSIRPEMEHDLKSREALIAEARLAARLQHPNLVQTLEVGEEAGQLYIAMEFLDGQPLSKVVRAAALAHKRLDPPIIAAVLSDMLAGLHAAHELSDYDGRPLEVIHRDVSPQNVFLTYEGEVKLVDFGVAKAATGGEVTQAGIIKGKPAYLAPEQALGLPVDRRADLYAAGIVAWELFSGRRLFRADTPAAAEKLQSGPAPPLASVAEGIPAAIAAVVDRALARDREQRFATAREMRAALELPLESSGVRKARREEVWSFVAELFERDRRWLQERIRESIAASEQETPADHTPAALPNLRLGELPTPHTPKALASRVPLALAFVAGLAALGLGFLGFRLWPRPTANAPGLRLCGSYTIGASLAPALVEGFFRHRGAAAVDRSAGEQKILLSAASLAVSIETAGTATGFKGFAAGQCDVGMASRAMSDEEAKTVGDLRAPANELVIALDAIAVIVHPNNRVRSLDIDQVKAIFSGAIKDWSAVGGAAGAVEVLALDEQSTTWDTFKQLALGSRELAASARRFDDSPQLSDRVAAEPGAIGFVGLAFVRSANALAISQRGLGATLPSPFTVASESYPFSRRLYLYTLPKPRKPLATDFVDFVLSSEGQQIVRQSGFVDLSIAARSPVACDSRCPPEYSALTRGARRLTLDFRFREDKGVFDSRAIRDVDRLVSFLRSFPTSRLMLLGFSDDQKLSLDRARIAAVELERRGVKAGVVKGFGAAMPIWPGGEAAGRQRNRRVEVWIRDGW
jgi:phosphate binding protein